MKTPLLECTPGNPLAGVIMNKTLSYTVALSLFTIRIMAQTTTPSPTAADAQRAAEVDQRGDEGMGFSHAMTGLHFPPVSGQGLH